MAETTYADLASLKDWLDLTDTTTHDYKLGTALIAATEAIDNHCNRSFFADEVATHRYVVPTGTRGDLFVPDISDESSIEIHLDTLGEGDFDTEVTGFTVVHTTPIRRIHVYELPLLPTYTVKVTALFGWPEIPVAVEQACLILAARLFKRALSPEGITSSATEFGPIRVTSRDFDVEALLAPYKLRGWA